MCAVWGWRGLHSQLQLRMVEEGPNYFFQVYVKLPNETFAYIFYFYCWQYGYLSFI